MSLKRLLLSTVFLCACATAQPQAKPVQPPNITDAFCGTLNRHRICTGQYSLMEVTYAKNIDSEFPDCSMLVNHHGDKGSEFFKDYGCDGIVDSYLHTTVDGSKIFMVREEFKEKFSELDSTYRTLRDELLDATGER